jgi:hypothetical protein
MLFPSYPNNTGEILKGNWVRLVSLLECAENIIDEGVIEDGKQTSSEMRATR